MAVLPVTIVAFTARQLIPPNSLPAPGNSHCIGCVAVRTVAVDSVYKVAQFPYLSTR